MQSSKQLFNGTINAVEQQGMLVVGLNNASVQRYLPVKLRHMMDAAVTFKECVAKVRQKAAREKQFSNLAIANGLGIGSRMYMEWNGGSIVVVEVVGYQNAAQIICKYPDGQNYCPAGGSIDAVLNASKKAANERTMRGISKDFDT